MSSPPETLDRGMARGLVAFRWLALSWAAIGVVLQRNEVTRWWLAVLLLSVAALITVFATVQARTRPLSAGSPLLLAEVATAASLLLAETLVFAATRDQSLGWAWPSASIIAVSVAAGVRWGMTTAVGLAAASTLGESWLKGEQQWGTTSSYSKAALLVLAALAAAAVASVMRDAAQQISSARAREEMARVLHDGVLQTLAVIQRRSDDDQLISLARDQERDLRAHLFGAEPAAASLAVQLRAVADTVARRHDIEIGIVVAVDLPDRPQDVSAALSGAASEALTNAAKHAHASRISLFAEPDDDGGVVCSVHDNGAGFDRARARLGAGIIGSIEQRLAEVGGRATITSASGRGTDVQLWVP